MDQATIIQAAKDGDANAVKALLRAHPDLAAARASTGETPLMAALYRGHRPVIDALLAAGVPLDIFAAAAIGNQPGVDLAVRSDAGALNAFAYDGWTPLHLAAFFGHTEVARRLLDAGASPNTVSQNSLRNTPLHAAVAGGHVEVSLLLISRAADVNTADAGGHTPFHIAAEGGYVPVVKALLDRGADPHIVDAEDRTPLARAAARNHTEVVDLINLAE